MYPESRGETAWTDDDVPTVDDDVPPMDSDVRVAGDDVRAASSADPPQGDAPEAKDALEPSTGDGTPVGSALRASDEEVANHIAQRGFVWSAWAGAVILTFSYAQLYWALLAEVYDARPAMVTGILTGILGAVVFMRSRNLWQDLGGTVSRRSMTAALLFAGAGGIFWLLFVLLFILTLLEIPVL